MRSGYDILVVGAGIAGASVAANLAPSAKVLLAEMESAPGYHTTGRSAALFSKTYGPAPIRALSRASEAFFYKPGAEFATQPLLTRRGVILAVRENQLGALDRLNAELGSEAKVTRLSADEAQDRCPLFRKGYLAAALLDEEAQDIDVDALHRGYLRAFAKAGGALQCDAPLHGLARDGDGWLADMGHETIRAGVVVNAAGAWADQIGVLARAAPIGLVPKRRTAAIVAAPDGFDPSAMQMIVDIEEQFYLKPEAGKLLISPADETPSDPCDAQPEEIDVAIAVDRIETAFDLKIHRIEHKWAGLRSFVSDKCPVAGFDPNCAGFFWLAGQGGYGIQSAPALARFAASQILGQEAPEDILAHGLDPMALTPRRLKRAA